MEEIDQLRKLKSELDSKNLNESDTRFQIIDVLLTDILKFPRETITTEKYIDGNRADYVIKGKNDKPILIIESKKNSIYFELPKNLNHSKRFEKILVEKLLTNQDIKDAIAQVKEYAEDLFCNFAAICNGKTWILFKINSNVKPWKKLFAFVIKDIDFFIEEYTTAINVLGYTNITENDSLNLNIGVAKKNYTEVFYPKNNITTYDTPVNNNKYAGPLKSLSLKYLGPIPEEDINFMSRCYVSNKGKYDKLQKDVQGFLYDSLTPYFKNLGFRDFTEDSNSGAFGLKIAEIVKKENLNNVMILFGGRGAGKSTFLKRFLYQKLPNDIKIRSQVSLIGLLYSSQTKDELTIEIWNEVLSKIDIKNIRKGSRDQILDLFCEEFEIYKKQILIGLDDTSEKYHDLVRSFVKEHINNIKLFCEKLSIKLKSQNKALVIFIDNVDQLPPELQDVCFLTAGEISEKLGCLVIISMREERYYDANSRGVLDAYQSPGFHLASPVIPEVLIKRIEYIIKILETTPDLDTEFGIRNDSELNTLISFLNICKTQLKVSKSPLSFFLRNVTHGDVRQALEYFKGFLTSGYTNITEMSPFPNWTFQVHQVIKPMMIPERFFYDERKSKIPNLYQLRNDNESSHFTGLRILHLLHNKCGDKNSNGFVDVKYLLFYFENKYDSKKDCEKNLELFLEKGIIESNNRLDIFSEDVNQIKITSFGNYIYEYLAFNFSYLDLIALDTGLFDESLANSFIKSAGKELGYYYDRDFMSRIKIRLERVHIFIEYLKKIEDQEFNDLNLEPTDVKFSQKMEQFFEEDKKKILKSAENKAEIENEYN